MIIKEAGTYALLADKGIFSEWRYLEVGDEYDPSVVLPKVSYPQPEYDTKKQKLVEQITIREADVLQDWLVVELSPEEVLANKRPNAIAFMREGFSRENEEMFAIYQKIIIGSSTSLVINTWFTQLMQASQPNFFTVAGWNHVIMQLADTLSLSLEERSLVNEHLAKFDLDEVL